MKRRRKQKVLWVILLFLLLQINTESDFPGWKNLSHFNFIPVMEDAKWRSPALFGHRRAKARNEYLKAYKQYERQLVALMQYFGCMQDIVV